MNYIVVPVFTSSKDDLNVLEKNFLSIVSQGFPYIFMVQDQNDPVISVLKKHHMVYAFSEKKENNKVSHKVHNQLNAINLLPPEASIITFVDSDCYLPPNTIETLIKPIVDKKYFIASGKRIITNCRFLESWSILTSRDFGIFGGLMAVDKKWYCKHLPLDNAIADDWAIFKVAKSQKTEISYPKAVAFCIKKNTVEFLKRQYFWMKTYDKKMYLWVFILELLALPLFPLKFFVVYSKSKSTLTGLASTILGVVIIYIQFIVMFKKDISWRGFVIKEELC